MHTVRGPKNGAVVVDMDGRIVSRHRTTAAAERAVEREISQFHRSDHCRGGAYLPRNVVALDDDGEARIRRDGQYSTSWSAAE